MDKHQFEQNVTKALGDQQLRRNIGSAMDGLIVKRKAVFHPSELEQLRKQAFKEGMHTLRLSGAQKVGAGLTTIAEVLRVTPLAQDS